MDTIHIALISLVVLIASMSILWLVSLRLNNSSIVDIFWGVGFVIAAWLYFQLSGEGYLPRKLLVSGLTTVWGLRLSIYILWRNWAKAEDPRYQAWRQAAGNSWRWRSLFQVFLLQGFLIWLISGPILIAQNNPQPEALTWIDLLAVVVWVIGFFFESVGDYQMARFKRDPVNRGRIMDGGVWRYTRHPNYFGDAAQWWGLFLIAAISGGWWTVYSPILMTMLLLKVSGVTLLERTLETRPGYREYIQRTSPFIPWVPKRKIKED